MNKFVYVITKNIGAKKEVYKVIESDDKIKVTAYVHNLNRMSDKCYTFYLQKVPYETIR